MYTFSPLLANLSIIIINCFAKSLIGLANTITVTKVCSNIFQTLVAVEITSMSMMSLGALNDPSPYQFTCNINNVPHATLTLVIEGVNYVATDSTSITEVVSLSQLTSGTYQFLCIAGNSNGGDTQTSQFTIKGK